MFSYSVREIFRQLRLPSAAIVSSRKAVAARAYFAPALASMECFRGCRIDRELR
jgi:hypothetical protein